ncbi:DinB family protein [soil metagenome]
MNKSDINPMPPYFDRYINLVDDVALPQAFADSIQQLNTLDKSLPAKLGGIRYAPDKWTVKEIFQHIIDWERILSYRALLFARHKGAVSQDVDGDLFAAYMNAERRTIEELIEELKIVRASTIKMFESFDDRMLLNTGINWKYEMSVLATGFCLVGHQIHHLKIIEEKYFPLLEAIKIL